MSSGKCRVSRVEGRGEKSSHTINALTYFIFPDFNDLNVLNGWNDWNPRIAVVSVSHTKA